MENQERRLAEKIYPVENLLLKIGTSKITVDTAKLALIGASRVEKHSPLFGKMGEASLRIDIKDKDSTLVTKADISSQGLIEHFINVWYPNSTIWGEEAEIVYGNSGFEFMFDPLDGTGMYPLGVGASTTAVMSSFEGKPVASAIVDPFQNSMIVAQEGKVWAVDILGHNIEERRMKGPESRAGKKIYFWHDTTLRKTTVNRLAVLLPKLLETFPDCDFTELSTGSNVGNQAALCRSGGDLQLTYAIGGPWDTMIGAFAIEQAGGIVTDLEGNRLTKQTEGGMVSAATPELHQRFLSVVKEAFRGYVNFKKG